MDQDEAWAFLERGHTAILTTLRRDGWPVSLPLWYVVEDRAIYVATPERSKKVSRIRNDDRACLVVEQGQQWAELAAVELPVRATILEPGAEADRAGALFADKYAAFRPAPSRMPKATTKHYQGQVVIRLDPVGRLLSWDNAKLRLHG
ncbi:pyridoxamine 5'-phosphate oxidase family protein [Acidimicrobiia bacterium EGI L10123]|uniref:pyridoxamine 5'-phosphate oxidase family protein n=1 Tax=Salinilacustrithrix flava TaxID=2957203 RepID=UPI003D7C23D5|nr:pyridoxamine 5'-phosphate oxidase family protein [Acidimicrobiia bacterium EGI L10123]